LGEQWGVGGLSCGRILGGMRLVCTRSVKLDIVRILGGADGTQVSFSVEYHDVITLYYFCYSVMTVRLPMSSLFDLRKGNCDMLLHQSRFMCEVMAQACNSITAYMHT
jgi:hypothetical protein